MIQACALSDNSENYLESFRRTLSEMIRSMECAELRDSISAYFIAQMIPHHRAAIEMSQNLLRFTTNIPLQNIAGGIIAEQTASIENMREIRCACARVTNNAQSLELYARRNEQILDTMFYGMENAASTNSIDCNFIREMIPHHEGAVRMGENALRFNLCPGLSAIIEAIITSQRRGICQLRQLRSSLGCR